MEIQIKQKEDKLLVRLSGRFVDFTCNEVDDAVMKNAAPSINDVVINLKDVEYVSSAGLRTVVKLYNDLKKMNKRLMLAEPIESVKRVFDISNMEELVTIYNSEEDAFKKT